MEETNVIAMLENSGITRDSATSHESSKSCGVKPNLTDAEKSAQKADANDFLLAMVNNDVHGYLRAQGVADPTKVSPATMISMAKALCGVAAVICPIVEHL